MNGGSRPGVWQRWAVWIAVLLVGAFVGQGLAAILANSQTSDELPHFAAGYSYWATGDYRLNPEHPPFAKELCLLPVWLVYDLGLDTESAAWRRADQNRVGLDLLYGTAVGSRGDAETRRRGTSETRYSADTLLNLARVPNLLLGALLVCLVGWWGYRLWGPAAGLLAMALAALEPTVVAHSTFVATDLAWALFSTAALYAAWEFCRRPSWEWLVAIGGAVGLALASKFSSVSLVGVLPAAIGCFWLLGGKLGWLPPVKRGGVWPYLDGVFQLPFAVLIVGYVALVVVWATYFFQDPLLWWDGFQHVLGHQEHGHRAWFLGEVSTAGWWAYFPVALGVKTQIATLVLSGLSVVLFRKGNPLGRDGVAFLLVPLAMFFAALLVARINIGVRHALHVYPLLHVLAGRVATMRTSPAWLGKWGLGLLLGWSAISAVRIAPYPVAYFNELVGGPEGGRRILSDSNLDWGQGLRALARYVDDEELDGIYLSYFGSAPPEYYGTRYQYVPAFGPIQRPEPWRLDSAARELLAISDLNLKGIWFDNHNVYGWLAEREPVATLAHSIYLYNITDDVEAHFELARVYLQENLPQYAVWELEKVLTIDPNHSAAARLLETLEP